MLEARMTCREVSSLLPLFFDGELTSQQMRTVALHSTRCATCEGELRDLERVQDLVAASVTADVDAIDLSQVWPAVEARIQSHGASFASRWRVWWEEQDLAWWVRMPMLAGAAAALALAVSFWSEPAGDTPQVASLPPAAAVVDNSATIDSLDSGAAAVAVLSEPETNTMVLWINDDSDYGAEGFPP